MKKIIAASAALLLVGSAVVASAEVTFTGDARERFIMQEGYNFGNYYNATNDTLTNRKKTTDKDNGRVRVVINATTKGGAYANMRLRFADGTYGGTDATMAAGAKTNYYTDWAYIGIPIGPVTINAGLMPDVASLWFRYDKRFDRLAATWANKTTSVTAQFDKVQETSLVGATGFNDPTFGDMDINQWGLVLKQKFVQDWNMVAYGVYQDNQTGYKWGDSLHAAGTSAGNVSGSGLAGTIQGTGSAGPVKMLVELSYVNKNLMGVSGGNGNDVYFGKQTLGDDVLQKDGSVKAENGYGGIVHAKMNFGPADGTLIMGFTKGGYEADFNYGFLMMGGAMAGANPDLPVVGSPISVISRIGQSGGRTIATTGTLSSKTSAAINSASDTFFVGGIGDYQVAKNIKLVGIMAYADASDYSALEVSGLVNFQVTDGAYIDVGGGMLAPSISKSYWGTGVYSNTAYGVFTELGIKF